MEMIGFLGKKVDLVCTDGQKISGHVFDVLDAEDSDIEKDCVEIALLDKECTIVIPTDEIQDVTPDTRYKEFDFRH